MSASDPLRLFQVDCFTERLFAGNPAAVVPLAEWLPDERLQAIAAESNLSDTAFFVAGEEAFELRWFTPATEVQLCGHATLASAFVLRECLGRADTEFLFDTRYSGRLSVTPGDDGLYLLNLPRHDCDPAEAPPELSAAMGAAPEDVRAGPNWLLRYADAAAVRDLRPDMRVLAGLPERGVIATAPGDEPGVDFVSRFFAPNFGIDEDPVTGSAHCMLTPYWAGELGKDRLNARQVSARGGELVCEAAGDRVRVGGRAVLYMSGEIRLPKE